MDSLEQKILDGNPYDLVSLQKLEPDEKCKSNLLKIIELPDFLNLDESQTMLIWKYRYESYLFRYFLKKLKLGLTKILKAIDWSIKGDLREEKEVLDNFLNSSDFTINIQDILYMISYKFCMNRDIIVNIYPKHADVRKKAIECLKKLNIEELKYYTIQFVQALKYENNEEEDNKSLKSFIIEKSRNDFIFLTDIYWLIKYEVDYLEMKKSIKGRENFIQFYKKILDELEMIDIANKKLEKQRNLMEMLNKISNETKNSTTKQECIKKILKEGEISKEIICPIYPNDILKEAIFERTKVFSSAKKPTLFFFKTHQNEELCFIYKFEDILIKDQLILQLIRIFNNILKKEGYDINLTTYRVFSTKKDDGLIELVKDCKELRVVYNETNKNILKYFDSLIEKNPLKSKENLIKNFSLSTAMYSMITYVLMIGDRHFDNIMINNDNGQIFHIDFGHIFGHEARIRKYNQPIRFTSEFKKVISSIQENGFKIFLSELANIFRFIRKESRLITNILYLMRNSSIDELTKNNYDILLSCYEKFFIGTADDKLETELDYLLKSSEKDWMAYLSEAVHSYQQNK